MQRAHANAASTAVASAGHCPVQLLVAFHKMLLRMVVSFFWLLLLLLSLTAQSAEAQGQSADDDVSDGGIITYPSGRYVEWRYLDAASMAAAETLAYDESAWNLPGSADIETLSYETINATNRAQGQAIEALGMNEGTWDCYINHYEDYNWTELELAGVQPALEALGWTQELWEGGNGEPDSNDLFWSELSTSEREAAEQLCYIQQTWDDLSLTLWGTKPPTGPPTPPPTSAAPVTNSPTLPPGAPTVTPTTAAPSGFPSAAPVAPSPAPSAAPSPGPTASAAPTVSPQPTGAPTLGPIELPEFRYVQWDDLDASFQSEALKLGYERDTWNLPGSAPIEALSFETILLAQPDKIEVIRNMGYNEPTWDCYINHYGDFTWEELAEADVQKYLVMIGWTEDSWENENSDPPPADDEFWGDLTTEQRDGAKGICYFRQLWDEIPLTDTAEWPDNWSPTQAPTSSSRSVSLARFSAAVLLMLAVCAS